MVELNSFCHPCLKQECKLLKLPEKNSMTVTSLPGKVQTCTLFKELSLVAKKHYWKQTEWTFSCWPFVAALQLSCPGELPILWTFAVCSSAVTNKRYFRKVFSSVGRASDCRVKSSVGIHGKFLTFKRLQQSCFSSTEQHFALCQLSQVHIQVSQHGQCSRQNCTQCTI